MKHYQRQIIFTKTPLKKTYRYKDVFQILPMDLVNAPTHKHARLFPCILEFWHEGEKAKPVKVFDSDADNLIAKLTVPANKIIEITNFLSVVSNFRFIYNRTSKLNWTVLIPEENNEEVNNQSSIWSMEMYYYPTMADELKINSFSNTTIDTVDLIPRKDYYYKDPVESHKKEINFPDTFENCLTAYFELGAKEKIICDSSIYQLCNSLDLDTNMKSLSFLSAVSAIETLVNYEFRNEKIEHDCNDCKAIKTSGRNCQKCGRPIWGIAAKFREFLNSRPSKSQFPS